MCECADLIGVVHPFPSSHKPSTLPSPFCYCFQKKIQKSNQTPYRDGRDRGRDDRCGTRRKHVGLSCDAGHKLCCRVGGGWRHGGGADDTGIESHSLRHGRQVGELVALLDHLGSLLLRQRHASSRKRSKSRLSPCLV